MENENPEELKFNNEIEKLKLQAEFGAGFFGMEGNIPPEIEAEWLKNVRAFEEQTANRNMQTVAVALGSPVFKPLAEISENDIEAELEAVLELMESKNIVLDFDEQVPASEIYRFITEELILEETEVIDIPGYRTHYIYEEFYPNHEKDIFRSCDGFALNLFDRKTDFLKYNLDQELVFANGTMMLMDEFIAKADAWFQSVDSFRINKLAYMAPKFDLNQNLGHIDFFVDYDAVYEGGSVLNYTGPGIFYVHYIWGMWCICGMDFPGFKEWAFENR